MTQVVSEAVLKELSGSACIVSSMVSLDTRHCNMFIRTLFHAVYSNSFTPLFCKTQYLLLSLGGRMVTAAFCTPNRVLGVARKRHRIRPI